MIGSLLYVANWTRPDISFAVSELSRMLSNPGQKHLTAAKRVFRYLKGTITLTLQYKSKATNGIGANILWGFVDSDWGGCRDTRRSTTGYALMLNRGTVS